MPKAKSRTPTRLRYREGRTDREANDAGAGPVRRGSGHGMSAKKGDRGEEREAPAGGARNPRRGCSGRLRRNWSRFPSRSLISWAPRQVFSAILPIRHGSAVKFPNSLGSDAPAGQARPGHSAIPSGSESALTTLVCVTDASRIVVYQKNSQVIGGLFVSCSSLHRTGIY